MPDPFRDVRPGDPVAFEATTWNAVLAAARAEQSRKFDGGAGTGGQSRNAGIVRVKNESGVDLLRGAVLGLTAPIFTSSDDIEAFLREVTFRGVVPTAELRGRFCVLLEPAPVDRVVRACVSGVCPVRLDVQDAADTHADSEPGETGHLNSCSGGGSAQVLWREGDDAYGYGYGAGEQWALVRLGPSTDGAFLAKLNGPVTARSGSTVHSVGATIQARSSSSLAADPVHDTITVWNLTDKNIASGAYVFVVWGSGDWWVVTPGSCGNLS